MVRQRQVKDRLRRAALPSTSDVDLLLEGVAAHLDTFITVVADPGLRPDDDVQVRGLPGDGAVELRIPARTGRTPPLCRGLGWAFYPHDPASARCAAYLLEQHLLENQEIERQAALDPVEAYLDKLAGQRPLILLRPVLAPRR